VATCRGRTYDCRLAGEMLTCTDRQSGPTGKGYLIPQKL
jgi:hypothetical protein